MTVPLKYTVRSLLQRKSRALLTILGIAAVVAVAVAMVGLARGMAKSFGAMGSPDNVVVLQRGAFNQSLSSIPRSSRDVIQYFPHLQKRGEVVLASPELVVDPWVTPRGRRDAVFMVARGVEPVFFAVADGVRVVQGSATLRGNGVLLGRVARLKLGGLGVGDTIGMFGEQWTVTGFFEAAGTNVESEVLADLTDLMRSAKREEYSSFTLKLAAGADAAALIRALHDDRRILVTAVREPEYYAGSGKPYRAIAEMGLLIALIVTLGAVFGGMNTMYTAVSGRLREIGTLRALGYSRWSVLFAFLAESVLLSGTGGLVGVAVGAAVNGLRINVRSASIPFAVGAEVVVAGLLLSVLVGLIGGLLPARGAARVAIVEAMRRA